MGSQPGQRPTPVSASAAAAELPPPPSGDFELSLTPDQLATVVERRHGRFLAGLQLPPDRLARLRDLLSERQQVTIDAANAAVMNGANPVRDVGVIVAATQDVQKEVDAQLRQEFGETVFAAFREAERLQPAYNSLADLTAQLTSTQNRLTPGQAGRLLQLFQSSPFSSQAGDATQAVYGDMATRARISEAALKTAATFLSPAQLRSLESLNLIARPRAQ